MAVAGVSLRKSWSKALLFNTEMTTWQFFRTPDRVSRICAAVCLLLAVGAFGAEPGAGPLAAYVLGPGDKVRVVVFGETDLSGEFSVGTSGTLALPLVGPVAASGKAPSELEAAIIDALSPEYLREPRVSVEVLEYRPYFILGEVKAPGSYAYSADVNVRRAAALAGGYTYRAKTGHAYVTRVTAGKESRHKASPETPLLPGDIVEIPERFF